MSTKRAYTDAASEIIYVAVNVEGRHYATVKAVIIVIAIVDFSGISRIGF